MKALLMKDIITLSKQSKTLLVIVLAYGVFGLVLGNTFFISALPVMMLSLLAITSFSYDNLCKWDVFALTMPITKKQIVGAKYLLALLFILVGSVFALLLSLLSQAIYHSSTILEIFATLGGYVLVGLAINTVMLPLVFKTGVEKARMALILIFLVPVILIMLLARAGFTLPTISPETGNALLIAIPIVTIVLFALSYRASLSIYQKRES